MASEPFLGQVLMVSFSFAPRGWALCNGQLLPINQNQALFSLLGTTYGGDGRVNFALPNLQGRAPVHPGSEIFLGQSGGEQNHTLVIGELPAHTHSAMGANQAPNQPSPVGHVWANNAANPYSATPNGGMNPTAIPAVGGSQAHNNTQPFLVINFIIALQGIFPSRN